MDSGNNSGSLERLPNPANNQPNVAPGLGNVATNMPNNGNAVPSMPDIAPQAPEMFPLGSPEQLSNPESQIGPGQSNSGQATIAQSAAQPLVVPQGQPIQSATPVATASPTAAADEDLIEQEWIDQTKKVISASRDDPHEQARLIAELMRDYVRKRYGKEVGKAPEDY